MTLFISQQLNYKKFDYSVAFPFNGLCLSNLTHQQREQVGLRSLSSTGSSDRSKNTPPASSSSCGGKPGAVRLAGGPVLPPPGAETRSHMPHRGKHLHHANQGSVNAKYSDTDKADFKIKVTNRLTIIIMLTIIVISLRLSD